jgi:phage tail-like protein
MFRIEIDGIHDASFSEVQGLEMEFEIEPYREGGVNNRIEVFSKGVKHDKSLTLIRGISHLEDQDELCKWFKEGINGKITRKDVTVVLVDTDGKDVRRWMFKAAYPKKWTGPVLKADSNKIAIESFELTHEGIIFP